VSVVSAQVRIVLVDDEPPARRRLQSLLALRDDVELVASCGEGNLALQAVEQHNPDILLLDIKMPELSGLDVVRRLGPETPYVIFITAHDEHAVTAFELAAIDYILKPFTEERLFASIDRAIHLINSSNAGLRVGTLQHLLDSRDNRPATQGNPWAERVGVDKQGRLQIISLADVSHITADGPFVNLHKENATHLIRVRIRDLNERLDPAIFWRIHRSTIVNVNTIRSLCPTGSGDYVVTLHSGVELRLSRTYRDGLVNKLKLL